MEKNLICICCPMGCHLQINLNTKVVTGNGCNRGAEYAVNEITNPVRIITTTVKVKNGALKVVSVKTKAPISKNLNFKCMEVLNSIEVEAPISIGQVIVENILGTGVDVIATKNIKQI